MNLIEGNLVTTVLGSLSDIREHINTPRVRRELMGDSGRWTQICSSMDVVEDTQCAIDAYHAHNFEDKALGIKYLSMYGLLQALFVQQDAVEHLASALDIQWSKFDSSTLEEIRKLRNDSVGHPTRRKDKSGLSYHLIVQRTLTHEGFDLQSFYPDQPIRYRRVVIADLISEQAAGIAAGLEFIHEELSMRDKQHLAKFADRNIVDCFPDTLSHGLEKLEAFFIDSTPIAPLANYGLDMVEDCVSCVETELKERGEWSEFFDDDYMTLHHSIEQLRVLVDQNVDLLTDDQRLTGRVFAEYLGFKLSELEDACEEVDQQYNADREAQVADD